MQKDKRVESAEKYVADGKYDKALKVFQKLFVDHPQDLRLQLKLGDLYVKRKEISHALDSYRAVAEAYVKERFHLKAVAVYKRMLKLNPTMIEINAKLGDLYCDIGLLKDAQSQYLIVADHYEQMHRTDELLAVRRKLVEIEPSSITNRIRLAEIYQKEGNAEDSLREYQKAAEDLRAKNDKDKLIEVYEKILYHRPDQLDLFLNVCQLYIEKGEIQKAQQHIESVKPELRKDPDIMELAIQVYLKLEQREKVRQFVRDLFTVSIEQGQSERASKVYALAQAEFSDDEEYIAELDGIGKELGWAAGLHEPISEEELEKTASVRVDDLAPPPTKAPKPAKESDIDLDKTVMVRLDEVPAAESEKQAAGAKRKPSQEKEPANLDETVMVNVDELEKQFKNKKTSQ